MPAHAEPHHPWTAERVRALPEDGRRYEVVGGALLVTPAPGWGHQRVLSALLAWLRAALEPQGRYIVLASPADLTLGDDVLLQPDLFVAPGEHRQDWPSLEGLPLVVEILAPSTAARDRVVKRRLYQRARVAEYWIVDLDARLVERWRPADERPEVLTDRLEWTPPGGDGPVVLDVQAMLARELGEVGEG